MAYATHVRITCSGRLGEVAPGAEKFSFGLSYQAVGGLTDTQLAAMNTRIRAYFTSGTPRIGSSAILEQVKFATITSTGAYADVPKIYGGETPGGGASGTTFPPQIALAVSFDNNPAAGTALTPRGRRRGRFYLPLPQTTLGTNTFLIPQATAQEAANATAALFTGLNTDGGGNVVVASKIDGNHVVNRVRVGEALDTIRSRRRSLKETYQAATV